jgi:hypothetical protein
MSLIQHGSLLLNSNTVENQEAPEWFYKKLQSVLGKDLHVEWNHRRGRWVVEQCVQHYAPTEKHSHVCSRVYVWLVQGDGSEFMPLGDRVIEYLQSIETTRKYGTGEAALSRFLQESKNFDEQQKNDAKLRTQEAMTYARKHNKFEWNKFWTLFKRHSMKPNK